MTPQTVPAGGAAESLAATAQTGIPRVVSLTGDMPRASKSQAASTVTMYKVPPHCLVGCQVRLMAKVESGEGTAASGVVRFYDQYGLLGVAAVDSDTGLATLPYAFTSGGRREIRAEFTGSARLLPARSEVIAIRIYSSTSMVFPATEAPVQVMPE
ncbi:MAG: hypothetical protein CSA58_10525 [Micrococcales bacterium]|nr:MAG: hypothetical protein CSB46_01950 [Micrococcales bacterium]PIE26239.1 MAG: hypothetical protein CSA58_10525 [Micrococcales bacterium]